MKGIKVEGGLTESVLFELNYQTCVWPKTQNVERISVSITLLRAGDLKIWVAPTRSKRRCLGDRVVFLPGRKVGMGKLLMFHFKNQSLVSQRLYIIIYRYMDTVNSERLKKKTGYWPFKFRYVKDSSQTIKSKRNVENSLSGSVTWLCLPTPFLLTVSNAAHNISGLDHRIISAAHSPSALDWSEYLGFACRGCRVSPAFFLLEHLNIYLWSIKSLPTS